MTKSSPKFGETTPVSDNVLLTSVVQDDHVRGPRNYREDGQYLP